jgi:hypothetical protein
MEDDDEEIQDVAAVEEVGRTMNRESSWRRAELTRP